MMRMAIPRTAKRYHNCLDLKTLIESSWQECNDCNSAEAIG
jgi:hypothetical protein